jgi:uncharacterized protein (TIGR03437 family)
LDLIIWDRYILYLVKCEFSGLIVSLCLISEAIAQPFFVQQGDKLVDPSASQGDSVALSADGNTAVVSAGFLARPGAIVYSRLNGVWTEQAQLVETGFVNAYPVNNLQGSGQTIALASDGNTLVVGRPDDNDSVGAAFVFTRSASSWRQLAKLIGTGAAGVARQGYSVAISGDGSTVMVGGPYDDGGAGAAWVFVRSGNNWFQQGSKLVGSGAAGSAHQGDSVALSGDGSTAIVGGHADNIGGAAWAYTRSGSSWSQQGEKLVGADVSAPSALGQSAALSADGNTAIVGGSFDDLDRGAAWVFTRSAGVWTQQGGKLVGTGFAPPGQQGQSVALSADGNIAAIGGPGDTGTYGAVWAFERSNGVWQQQGDKLIGSGGVGGPRQGASVALSGDGSTLLVGGPGDAHNGAAWVFVLHSGPYIAPRGVVNGASFLPGIAPGTWITIFGSHLSATTRGWTQADLQGSSLPTQLDGVSVSVNGKPAYVSYISPTQLNVLAPDDDARGLVQIQVTSAGQSDSATATESDFSPGLFMSCSALGNCGAAAIRPDGTVFQSTKAGDIILLYGTGFGPSTPASPTGQLVNAAPLANNTAITVGGVPAAVQWAGIVGPGLYQFNVVVPNAPNGLDQVSSTVGGQSSQPNVLLAIQ